MTARGAVSIVIPSLNTAEYIVPCVESALAQTHPAAEVIVVDAGSTDGTLGELERYGGRVRVVDDPGGSIPHSVNVGISEMRGEWLKRLDSDDVMHPRAVESLLAAADPCSPGSSIPHFDYARVGADGRDTGVKYRLAYNHLSAFGQGVRQIDHIFGSTTMCLVHRSVLERAGPLDERFEVAEDREFALRCLLLHGMRFVNVPSVLYGYRVRGGQHTGNRGRIRAEAGRAVRHVLSGLPAAERRRYEGAAAGYGRLHGFMYGVWSHASRAAGGEGGALAAAAAAEAVAAGSSYASLRDEGEREGGRRWAARNGGHPLVRACAGAAFAECWRMGSAAWGLLETLYASGGLAGEGLSPWPGEGLAGAGGEAAPAAAGR